MLPKVLSFRQRIIRLTHHHIFVRMFRETERESECISSSTEFACVVCNLVRACLISFIIYIFCRVRDFIEPSLPSSPVVVSYSSHPTAPLRRRCNRMCVHVCVCYANRPSDFHLFRINYEHNSNCMIWFRVLRFVFALCVAFMILFCMILAGT